MVTKEIIDKFDVVRPYNDIEAEEVIERILKEKNFFNILKFLGGDDNVEKFLEDLKNLKTVEEFQNIFSNYAVEKIVEMTMTSFEYSGIENIDVKGNYLFVANHRDIVLDSALMQYALVKNNHKTSQITFGSNLMSSQLIVDLGKINKMFTLYRGGNRLEQYKNAILHSAYIYDVINNKKESVWIAQRDGRTKDGNDKTQISLLKMFALTAENPIERLEKLNIVPVIISYEYEPCDIEKTFELYVKEKTGSYIKSKNEDFNSVLAGIRGRKGKVSLSFGKPLNEFIKEINKEPISENEKFIKIAQEIDIQVYKNYKLKKTNYIAYDILNKSEKFKELYSASDLSDFKRYMDEKLEVVEGEYEDLKKIFLNIYGNPVYNFLTCI